MLCRGIFTPQNDVVESKWEHHVFAAVFQPESGGSSLASAFAEVNNFIIFNLRFVELCTSGTSLEGYLRRNVFLPTERGCSYTMIVLCTLDYHSSSPSVKKCVSFVGLFDLFVTSNEMGILLYMVTQSCKYVCM